MSRRSHSTKTRDVLRRLRDDGWVEARRGPGDYRQYRNDTKAVRVTIDHGEPDIPTGTLRSIYRQAAWDW